MAIWRRHQQAADLSGLMRYFDRGLGVPGDCYAERLRTVAEIVHTFWAALQRGEFITDAAEQAGTYRKKGHSAAHLTIRRLDPLPALRIPN